MDVALFVTCLTDSFYPRAGEAVVRVLEHLGCRVAFPAGQTCCGQPMFNNGYHDEARALARRMVRVFEPFGTVVCPSASCTAMVREHFADLLAGDPREAALARDLAAKTYEFAEFLSKVLRTDPQTMGCRRPGRVAYHYSCHMRPLGLTTEAEDLLLRVGGLELAPVDRPEQCCGFGGAFAVKFPAISGALAREKARALVATGAETVVCNEGGCALHLEGFARRAGTTLRFRHVAEILAEGFGLMPPSDEPARRASDAAGARPL